MGLRKKPSKPKRRVWRITPDAPFGEIVDPAIPPAAKAPEPSEPGQAPEAGWQTSSYDLLNGLEINESPDTLPNELFDQLFKP